MPAHARQPVEFEVFVSKHPQPSALLYPVLLAISIALFAAGFYLMVQEPAKGLRTVGVGLLAAGAACSVAVLLIWPLTSILSSMCMGDFQAPGRAADDDERAIAADVDRTEFDQRAAAHQRSGQDRGVSR